MQISFNSYAAFTSVTSHNIIDFPYMILLLLLLLLSEMVNLTTRLCWELVKKEGYIAIWQKPFNNSCYLNRKAATKPPLCDPDDDPDDVWYIYYSSFSSSSSFFFS